MNVIHESPTSQAVRALARSRSLAQRAELAGLVQDLLELLRDELAARSSAVYLLEPEGWVCLGRLGECARLEGWLACQPAPAQIYSDAENTREILVHPLGRFCLLAAGPGLQRGALDFLQLLEDQICSSLTRLYQISRLHAELTRHQHALSQRSAHLGGLSHQLRTPLSVVSGFCQMLLGDPELNHSQLESVRHIRNNGARLLDMIGEIVDIARLEAGQVCLTSEPLLVEQLLQDLHAALGPQLLATGREFSYQCTGSGSCLMADADGLRKVLYAVISTSSRLGHSGRIRLTAHLECEHPLEFEIVDEGAHADPAQLEKLFDPYSYSGQHQSGTTGLQLGIARHYAALMEGRIQVNQQSYGLVWRIELQVPVLPGEAPTPFPRPVPKLLDLSETLAVPSSAELMELAGAVRLGDVGRVEELLEGLKGQLPEHQAFWKRCQEMVRNFQFNALMTILPYSDAIPKAAETRPTVLLVDDNPTNLHILYRALASLECRCLVTQSGEEALRISRLTQPAVILLDILMPGWDGFETLRRLRDDSRSDAPSVIFLSALCDTSDKIKGLRQGACDYISKPFHPEEVVARVRLQLSLRNLQNQLRQRNQELSKSNQQKNELLGMAAHDLRNPLFVITSYAALLDRGMAGELDEKPRSLVNNIYTTGKEMQVLLEDLLSVSQIESGHLRLNLQPTDPKMVFHSCVYLQQFQAEAKNIQLRWEVQQPIPDRLPLDASKMKQALTNLLSNAIKFSHAQTLIQARLLVRDDHLVWEVEDQGPGIAAHELGRLFQPFQTAGVRTTGGERSTGLGLAIIKRILEGHNGKITVDSQVGRGSLFALHVPVASA